MPETQPNETRLELNRSGNYEIRWTERDANGRARTRTQSCHTKDEREAQAFRDAWLACRETILSQAVEHTVADLIQKYEEMHLEANGRGAANRWSLKPIKEKLGTHTLATLTEERLLEYRAQRKRQGRADGTIRRELGALVAVLNWSRKKKIVDRETILPDVDLPPDGAARENYVDEVEEERMWKLAADWVLSKNTRWRVGLFVCLALETAARARAIETLTWDRVKWQAGVIDYRDPSIRISKKRRVAVPISDRLRPVLEFARDNLADNRWVLGEAGSTNKTFLTFVRQHNIKGVSGVAPTRHDLRRTWATLRAQWGVDLFDIAGVLGDTIETVTKHYAHHSPAHLRNAVNQRGKRAA